MALAKKCDRCGKLHEYYPVYFSVANGEHFKNIREKYTSYNERKAIFMMFREVEKKYRKRKK